MKVVIDIGNTSVKVALYEGLKIKRKERFQEITSDTIRKFGGRDLFDGLIVSDVRGGNPDLIDQLRMLTGHFHSLSSSSRLPFSINYDTPETIGVDRLAAAAGALLRHPACDLLVIDAGSAVTIDMVTGNAYQGGSISPGLTMRFRALSEYTGRLPMLAPSKKFSFPGKSTKDAITGGVIMGLLFEINEYIRTFEGRHTNPAIIITGGDGEFIASLTESEVFYYPDLVCDGLNYLLDYNV